MFLARRIETGSGLVHDGVDLLHLVRVEIDAGVNFVEKPAAPFLRAHPLRAFRRRRTVEAIPQSANHRSAHEDEEQVQRDGEIPALHFVPGSADSWATIPKPARLSA